MIRSMTGFGESQAEEEGIVYQVEIRSLNNRYFKASVKVPELFQRYESVIDKMLRTRMCRGSVTYNLRIKDKSPASAYEINTAVLGEYLRKLKEIAASDQNTYIDLARLAEVPGVLQPPSIDEEVLNERFEIVRRLTEEAVNKLIEMREVEGQALLKDIVDQCADIHTRIREISQHTPLVVKEYHKTLQSRVQQLLEGTDGSNFELYQDAIAREVAIFAERCDINEETSRITSHLEQFDQLCRSPEQAGRKLDFLAQELLREANTIGSKSNNAEISRQVIEIKAAIDRIKEQVQNVV